MVRRHLLATNSHVLSKGMPLRNGTANADGIAAGGRGRPPADRLLKGPHFKGACSDNRRPVGRGTQTSCVEQCGTTHSNT